MMAIWLSFGIINLTVAWHVTKDENNDITDLFIGLMVGTLVSPIGTFSFIANDVFPLNKWKDQ